MYSVWFCVISTLHYKIRNLLLDDYQTASDSVNQLGYELVNFTDTTFQPTRTYYILRAASTNQWGTYVYYPDYCRSVVIQSPHAKKDANTGHQGIHVFKKTDALFYMVSGTHRCNSSSLSSCTGTTTNHTRSTCNNYLFHLYNSLNDFFTIQKRETRPPYGLRETRYYSDWYA